MQVIIHDREAADGYGEDFRKFFESPIDPFFAVERTFREEKRASHTASHAVIPAGHGNIDEMLREQSSWVRLPRCKILY